MSRIPWRRIIVEQLQLLESEAKQLEYEKAVPHVDITKELLCGWFDDTYHPEAEDFLINFSNEERQELASFNSVFSEQVPILPHSQGTVRTWHLSPQWGEVMSSAKRALAVLNTSAPATLWAP